MEVNCKGGEGQTYEVAVRVLLGLVASAVEEDGRTLRLGGGNEMLNALLALGGDDGAKVGALLETTVHVEGLGALGDLREPFLGLADGDHGAEGHTTLASSAKGSSHDGVQGLVLVAVGEDGSMVLSAQVGLHTLAIGRATGVDVFTGTVAADEADGLDGRLVEDEVDGLSGAVDDVDDTRGETGLLGQFGQDHGRTGVPLGGLHDQTVAGHGSNGDTPERDHCGEVWGRRLASEEGRSRTRRASGKGGGHRGGTRTY